MIYGFLMALCLTLAPVDEGPAFACGIKIGEATQTTAVVWVRLTQSERADFDRLPILTEGLPVGQRAAISMPTDIVPGMAGQVQLQYQIENDRSPTLKTGWVDVDGTTDYIHQFQLSGLKPDKRYRVELTARSSGSDADGTKSIRGSFRTAPTAQQVAPVRFIVSTCQAIRSVDAGPAGHIAYQQMLDFDPHFFVHTGDLLYYDKVPFAKNVEQARSKWHLMFAYQHNRNFHRHVSSYFMKDDHDTLKNDCWPGQTYGELTFGQGQQIFRQQVCMGDSTYRTIRWGRDLQIWMTENRDFRSPNRQIDGPEKTILGEVQKEWLLNSVAQSDAAFRFIISPGPIVGPDKKGKADNHANVAFAHEGQQLRDFIATQPNTYVICGDRHWQYCSEDPETGVLELGCGPINDQHSFGGNPGKNKEWHRYFSAKGGFLVIDIDSGVAVARWVNSSDVDERTSRPKVLHTEKFVRD